jgi:putative colanic acid biosynthesis acetyltransferase WcaF
MTRPGFYVPVNYVDRISGADRFARLLWSAAWTLLFRFSPQPLWGWRRTLLRIFGASVHPKARIYPSVRIAAPWKLVIGARSCLGPRVECYNVALITIEDDVTVSQYVYLCTASHDIHSPNRQLVASSITLCRGSWVFARAMIGPGVTVEQGAVVGASAMVTKSVAAFSVVAGNPARQVSERRFRGAESVACPSSSQA